MSEKKINKGGRPLKKESEKKKIACYFYLTEDEIKSLLPKKPRNYSKSEFFRDIILSKKEKIVITKNHMELISEIGKIGVNINQIAKKVNSFDSFSEEDKQVFYSKVEDLTSVVNEVYSILMK